MSANPVAFIFTPFSEFAGYKGNFASLIICFIPRILSGITPAYVIKRFENNSLYMDVIASIIGSLTNTILVMLFIFIFFRNEYEEHIRDKHCSAGECKALMKLHINPDICKGCGLCKRNCPVDAITGEVKEPHVIDTEKCIKCGTCKTKCPFHAIEG